MKPKIRDSIVERYRKEGWKIVESTRTPLLLAVKGDGPGRKMRIIEVAYVAAPPPSGNTALWLEAIRGGAEYVREMLPAADDGTAGEFARVDLPDGLVERLRGAGRDPSGRTQRPLFEMLFRAVAVLDAGAAGMVALPETCPVCGAKFRGRGDNYSKLSKIIDHARGAHRDVFSGARR